LKTLLRPQARVGARGCFKAFIIVLWLMLSMSLFRREARNLARLPHRASLDYDEAKLEADGAVYEFASNLVRLVPPEGSVTYLYKRFSLFKRAAYYLYPRDVAPVEYYGTLGEGLLGSEYLAVYLPASPDVVARLDKRQGLKKIYAGDGAAIYRVTRGNGA